MPEEAQAQRESRRRQGRGGCLKNSGKTARGASVSRRAGQHDDAEKAGITPGYAKAGKAAGPIVLSPINMRLIVAQIVGAYVMTQKPVRNYPACMICGCRPNIMILSGGSTCFLCRYCDSQYFEDLASEDAKLDRLIYALKISQEKHLKIHYALNVARGVYGLREAKKHQNKKSMKTGRAADIFFARRRRPGCLK